VLFETGAIVLHIAETRGGLLPGEAGARARAIAWMFAALSTLEPPLIDLSIALRVEQDQPWHADRLPLVKDRLRKRLADLEQRLGDGEWLEGDFPRSDLMVIDVLRRLGGTPLLGEFPPWPPMWRAARRGLPSSAPLPRSAVFQAAQEALAEGGQHPQR
jgi:glutathione S-transferase